MIWEEYFLDMIPSIAKKSKDNSTKVGAIITGPDHGIRSTGFNGFPRGIQDDVAIVPARYVRPEKYKWTEHAERNALYYAAKAGIQLDGCFLYVDWPPCPECARGIIGSGIVRVIVDGDSKSFNNNELMNRWKEDHDVAKTMLKEASVDFIIFKRDK